MSYFNYQNQALFYEEQGEGVPLLLLHGNTASSCMFYEIVKDYTPFFKVITIDFLGHGKSQRVSSLPIDLWYEEAQQVIAFIKEKRYEKVCLLGCSGGALVAINVALELPGIVDKVIADSFEGAYSLKGVVDYLSLERTQNKTDENANAFYAYMHGEDYQSVVDQDTQAVIAHHKQIGHFFHQPLSTLQADILLTGSKQDEFVSMLSPTFFEETYTDLLKKIGHGKMFLFEQGGHPAMLSNPNTFKEVALSFLLP